MANEMDVFRGFPTSRSLNRFFDDFFNRGAWDAGGFETMIPRTNVRESDDHYVVSCEMPGIRKSDLDIEIVGNRLHICGERKSDTQSDEGEQARHEYRKFEQTLMLPSDVDPTKVEADYEDGVLYLAVPKSESDKARKVEIGGGERGVFAKLREKMTGKSDEQKDMKAA